MPPTKSAERRNSSAESRLLPIAAACASVALAYKLFKTCVVRTCSDKLTIVYDVRRRSIFSSSATPEENISPRKASNVFQYLLRRCLAPTSKYVLVPPGGIHAVFSFPRSVLDRSKGVTTDCIVEDLQVADGVLRCVVAVTFYVDVREMERYLSVVGPHPPLEHVGRCVTSCLRDEVQSSRLTAAALLHKPNLGPSSPFVEALRQRLQSMLVSDCCVVLRDLAVLSVELSSTSTA